MRYLFVILTLLGCSEKKETWVDTPPTSQELRTFASTPGRYQLLQMGSMRRDQFLLDSQDGKVWQKVCAYSSNNAIGNCDIEAFEEVTIIRTVADEDSVRNRVEYAKKARTARK